MRHLLLVSIALAVSTPALARPSSAIPQFDAAQICHATSNLGLGDDQSFATCMRDETEARTSLPRIGRTTRRKFDLAAARRRGSAAAPAMSSCPPVSTWTRV